MRKIILSLTAITLFLSFSISAFALDNKKYQEKSDAIFRDLDSWFMALFDDHTGIYNEYKSGLPTEPINHMIIHMTSGGIKEQNFNRFKIGESGNVRNYEGAFTDTEDNLTQQQREQIITKGRELKNFRHSDGTSIIFTTDPQHKIIQFRDENRDDNWDDNGNRMLDIEEIAALRCDGFVEYCYAAGADIYIGGVDILRNPANYNEIMTQTFYIIIDGIIVPVTIEITKYSPAVQRSRMQSSTIQNPTLAFDFSTPSHNNALNQWNDPQSRDNTIEITWQNDATDEHSGLYGYFVKWDEKKDTIPTHTDKEIKADDQGKTLRQDTSPPLGDGKWYFHIRSIDKAGNWDEDNKGLLTTMHIGPFFIDTTLPQISISGVTDRGTYTPPVTVSYVVTDKNLDVSSVTANWGERVEIGKAASSYTFIAPGDHIVTVSAKDLAGNLA